MFYTVQQIAKRLGISKLDVIYQLIRKGELKAVNVGVESITRPTWRISQEALDDFLAARQSRPPIKATRSRRKKLANVTQYF